MKTRSEAEARKTWWTHWREADYTWDGLAKRPLYGWSARSTGKLVRSDSAPKSAKPASLQDLWRSEADRLVVDDDGSVWTVIHAPLYARSGAMFKASWDANQRAVIDAALSAAISRIPKDALDALQAQPVKRRGSRLASLGRQWPLSMDGAVLLALPSALSSLRLFKGDRVAFGEPLFLTLSDTNWDLRSPLFERKVSIGGSAVQEIRLRSAIALRDFYLDSLSVSRVAILSHEVFGDFGIFSLNEPSEILITRGKFHNDVDLDDVKCSILNISDAKIDGSLRLEDVKSDSIALNRSEIAYDFSATEIDASEFSGISIHIKGDASAKNWSVSKSLELLRAQIDRGISFEGLTCEGLNLSDAAIGEKFDLKGATIRGRSDFARAHFMKSAYFNGTRLGSITDKLTSAFKESRFDSFVDFRGAGTIDFAAFDGANFKAEVRFDQALFKNDNALNSSLGLNPSDEKLVSLENGLRALKQAAENARDRVREQTFYRYELMVRRRQSQAGGEEQLLSHVYDLVSRYGSSFARPMISASAIWLIFAFFYLALARINNLESVENMTLGLGLPVHVGFCEALNLSARSMFNLFGVWSIREPDEIFGAEAQLLHSTASLGLVTRLVSSIQSSFAGILLFLTALAARRRFQIS